MKKKINVKIKRASLSLVDDIVYAERRDTKGNFIKLHMSVLFHGMNVERKAIVQKGEPGKEEKLPVILCIPGGGFTHCERNRILPELQFLAENGYVIVSIDYRLSSVAKFPAQMEDVCSAVRFLKAHANEYHIDADRIGVLGRSAGGCLALTAGMNKEIGNSNRDCAYSTEVKAVCSMYGVTDLWHWIDYEIKSQYFSHAKTPAETKGGQYADGEEASPITYINENMAPILLLHGDNDPIVPLAQSERFYDKMAEMHLAEKADFYIISGAGHGSKEFFQEEIKTIIVEFFNRELKKEE